MNMLVRTRIAVATSALCVMSLSWAAAQETADRDKFRFTIDGAAIWMGTWGNDISVAEEITIDEQSDRDRTAFEEEANPLVTEMRSQAVPWIQVGVERGKWGISGELWTHETDGSTESGTEPFEAFRYHDLGVPLGGADVHLRAANELSVWTLRMAVTRVLSKSLALGVGLYAGELENRRNETFDVADEFEFIGGQLSAVVETESTSAGTLVGPSVDLRGSATLGERAKLRFIIAQGLLFSSFENDAVWRSAIDEESDFFGSESSFERLTIVSSTRAAVPVTDAHAILTFDLGSHVSVGVLALVSVWYDAPLALRFSQATGGWDPATSTLVFASIGPLLTVSF